MIEFLRRNYFKSPNNIFDIDISNIEKTIYLYLCRCSDCKGESYPSYASITKACGISESSAKRGIKKLVERGLITKKKRYKEDKSGKYEQTSNIYTLCELPSGISMTLPECHTDTTPSVSVTPEEQPNIKEFLRRNYFKSPNNIFDIDISNIEKTIYLYLCRCSDCKGESYPSYASITKACGISESSAKRGIKKLVERGLITKKKRYKEDKSGKYEQTSNIYTLCELLSGISMTSPGYQCDTTSSVSVTPKVQPNIKEYPIIKTTTTEEEKILNKQIQKKQDKVIQLHHHKKYVSFSGDEKNYDHSQCDLAQNDITTVSIQEANAEIEKVIGVPLHIDRLKEIVKKKGMDKIKHYLEHYRLLTEGRSIKNVAGDFFTMVVKEYQLPKHTKMPYNTNNKPINCANFEQRQYDDNYYDSLYSND